MNRAPFVIIFLILSSCTASKNYSLWTNKYCKLERLEYQEISDTIRVTKNGGSEAGIKINGKVILNSSINLDTVRAYLNGGNKVFINQTTFKVVKVSQTFYEQYNKNRSSLCQIVEGVKSGIISSKEGKSKAEDLYLKLVEMFASEEKKQKKYVRKLMETNESGNPYVQLFQINADDHDNSKGLHAALVVQTYYLDSKDGEIYKIERECVGAGCPWNYRIHNFPDKGVFDFVPPPNAAAQYWQDCHITDDKHGFTYYRKWDGLPCTEIYKVYYKIPAVICVENCD